MCMHMCMCMCTCMCMCMHMPPRSLHSGRSAAHTFEPRLAQVIARVDVKHAHDPNEPLVSGGHALLEGLTPEERRSLLDQAPLDRLLDSRRDHSWVSRATRLERYTVPRCWVPSQPRHTCTYTYHMHSMPCACIYACTCTCKHATCNMTCTCTCTCTCACACTVCGDDETPLQIPCRPGHSTTPDSRHLLVPWPHLRPRMPLRYLARSRSAPVEQQVEAPKVIRATSARERPRPQPQPLARGAQTRRAQARRRRRARSRSPSARTTSEQGVRRG